MYWNDETLEGLSKSVKHANGKVHWHMINWTLPQKGWVRMNNKCANVNECGDNMLINVVTTWYEAYIKDERNLKLS